MRERDAVDRVLAGMGGAEPGAGMEGRVLQRLAAETFDERPAPIGSGWMSWQGGLGFTVACVCGLMVCGVGVLLVPHATEKRSVTAQQGGERSSGHEMAQAAAEVAVRRMSVRKSSVARRVSTGEQAVAAGPQPEAGAGSRAGMESFPAPPMALTRQERLLLRMLAGGQWTELAATQSAEAETAMAAWENTGRVEFFKPVRPSMEGERKDGGEGEPMDAVGHEGPAPEAVSDEHGTMKEKE